MRQLSNQAAIIIAGALIALAILFQGQVKFQNPLAKKTETPTTLGTQAQQAKYKSAKEAFLAYAQELGLNKGDFESCYDSNKYDGQIDGDLADGKTAGVTGTPTLFINGFAVVGAVPYDQIKQVIDNELAGVTNGEKVSVAATGPSLGQANAPVTVIEFSDFQCPFCAKLVSSSFESLKKDYVDAGKVKLVFRHYPLGFHKNAKTSAKASMCANDQGKFWQMHDELFAKQGEWSEL